LVAGWLLFSLGLAAYWHNESHRGNATIEQMRLSLEAANAGRWLWDFKTGRVHSDERQIRLLGGDPANFDSTFETFMGRIHPEDRPWIAEEVESSVAEKRPLSVLFRVIHPDGSIHLLRSIGRLTQDGKAMAGVCVERKDPIYVPPGIDFNKEIRRAHNQRE
jgi:PAS domain-containing protein